MANIYIQSSRMDEDRNVKTKKRRKCSFAGCEVNNVDFPDVHMFGFPVNRPQVCCQWVDNCANEHLIPLSKSALKERKVCQNHFNNDHFTNEMKLMLKKKCSAKINLLRGYFH